MAIVFPIAYKTDTSGLRKAQSEFGQFAKGLKATLGAVGLGIGLAGLATQLRDVSKAAMEDSKGQALLAQQIRNSISASDDQIASIEQTISSMELSSGVLDDHLRPAYATLIATTKDVGKATELMSLSLDLAAAKNISVEQASQILSKAFSGQTGALTKLIPSLKNSSDIFGDLQKSVQGASAAAANADPFQQLTVTLNNIQEQIGYALLPSIKEFAKALNTPSGQAALQSVVSVVVDLVSWLGKAVTWVAQNIEAVKQWAVRFAGITAAVYAGVTAWKAYQLIVQIVTMKQALLDIAMGAVNPVALAIGIGILGASLWSMLPGLQAVNNEMDRTKQNQIDWGKVFTFSTEVKQFGGNRGTKENPIPQNAMPGTVYTYWNYYDGTDKPAVWWTQTWDGKSWSKPKRVTMPESGAPNTSAKDKAAAALAQRIKDIAAFKKQVSENLQDIIPEKRVMSDMGEFEGKVVKGFNAIADSMQKAFDNKLIAADALAVFQKYAAGEQAALQTIAKARDVLSKKIDIARTLVQSVRDFGNITSAINTQSESVTESYTKVIDGVNVTISKTMEVAKATDVVAAYKAIIDKTKNFATNLKALKTAGLNGQLFAQIVSAGVDAGGETAAAIVAGGADTIASLNDLFGQLDDAATTISATSTDIMYQTGLDITNSFIDGLMAQDTALQTAATNLATNFNNAFKNALDIAVPSSGAAGGAASSVAKAFNAGQVPSGAGAGGAVGTAVVTGVVGQETPTVTMPTFVKDYFSISGLMSSGLGLSVGEAAKFLQVGQTMANTPYVNTAMADRLSGATVNVTVNAGLGTNGQDVATQIVSAISQYQRTNGNFQL
jgi:hypothetical protein